MGDGFVRQQSQRHGSGNAVVTAQRSALGVDTGSIMGHVKALRRHIDGTGSLLLADHVDVTLQNHGVVLLHTAGARGKENDVVHFVLNIGKALSLSKADKIVRDLLCIPGAVGNGANFFEIAEYCLRLQPSQFLHFHNNRSLYS